MAAVTFEQAQKEYGYLSFTEGLIGRHFWNAAIESLDKNLTLPNTGSHATAPIVVCLCGSTRFSEAFREANLKETLAGSIVLSIGCDTRSDQGLGLTVADKEKLDDLHLRKIDLASEVLILNVGGYIGNSTRRELDYATAQGKRVRYLEPQRAGA
jgi:hypothetical protein